MSIDHANPTAIVTGTNQDSAADGPTDVSGKSSSDGMGTSSTSSMLTSTVTDKPSNS